MKRLYLSFALVMLVLNLSAQYYRFDSIPDNLKRGANAVIRSEQCLFTILKPGNAVRREKVVITLLNESASDMRTVVIPYDKSSRINYLKGLVYDEKGEIIKSLGIMDVQDMSAISGGTFYTDDRVKTLFFPKYKYPFTIEYEWEQEMTSLFSYPLWLFQGSSAFSVEKSGIQVVVPKGMVFKSMAERLKNPVDSVIENDVKIYTWQEENIPADSRLKYTYSPVLNPPSLYLAPMDFEYGGFKGSMSSWKSFGSWYYNLIKGRDDLKAEQKGNVVKLVANAKDDREKVKLIYEYVQANTRYVLIDIGIGGLQPSLASDVAKNGFGDCKGLVNYTKSLLSAAGIESIFTLVRAGEVKQISKDFVMQYFNHAILCVPLKSDTIWLDCTSQTLPFNYLGDFTDDRYALLVTSQGGQLVKTPAYRKGETLFSMTGSVSLNILGKSFVKFSSYYTGEGYDYATDQFGQSSEDEIKKDLISSARFSDFTVTKVQFKETKAEEPSASFSYEGSITDFATLTGKLMIFNPSFRFERYLQDIPVGFDIKRYITYSDSITYNLPVGYKLDYKPTNTEITSEFGNYSFQVDAGKDKIIYKRHLDMNKGKIPEAKFADYRKFINAVASKDREIIILVKN
jgi:transglutaminase-like putative cysteine protease